jgi:hypothetical protein
MAQSNTSRLNNPEELSSAVPSDYGLFNFVVVNNRIYNFVGDLPIGNSPLIEIIALYPTSK